MVVETEEQGRPATQMPKPTGWRILCAVPEVGEKFEGTEIVRPDSHRTSEQFATVVLFVLDFGPDAYKDEKKFPTGAWCEKGDFVLVRQYSGTRMMIHGKEFRMIADDQVEAVVEDPRGYSRVY